MRMEKLYVLDDWRAERMARWILGEFGEDEAAVQYCAATLESYARGRGFGVNGVVREAARRRLSGGVSAGFGV